MPTDVTTPSTPLANLNMLALPVLILAGLGMIILPIPPLLLDMLFSFNIALALILLIVSIHISRPLDLSIFPTLILVATLMRLALNIASTRVVLLHGQEGPAAAGRVIQSFGDVVIAGNYVVGILVFLILVIVNFVVITKGGGRISEVSARFTLDAMPGKQVSIDADLNAGIIDHTEARKRRDEVTREADFYGAMDGASKFVRGDAVAGLLIMIINLIGGVCIGMIQHDMELSEALYTYATLTVGDGLVAQIPALVLSTTAAIMVTRVSKAVDLESQVNDELLGQSSAILTASGILLVIGLVPGMPHFAFITFSALLWLLARKKRSEEAALDGNKTDAVQGENKRNQLLSWGDIPPVNSVGLDIGYKLIPLLSSQEESELANQIRTLRLDLSKEYGFLIPMVHIRDSLSLDPDAYSILLHGVEVDRFSIRTGFLMAIPKEREGVQIDGHPVTEPSYGLDAFWILPDKREEAIQASCTVVDEPTIITTHLGRVVENHIGELFGYEQTKGWLDNLKTDSPNLRDELISDRLPVALLMKILKRLLEERVAIYDSQRIAATLLEYIDHSTDIFYLVQRLRITLRRQILHTITEKSDSTKLTVFTLSSEMEKLLLMAREQMRKEPDFLEDSFPIEPKLSMQLQQNMVELVRQAEQRGDSAVLLVAGQLRPMLSRYSRAIVKGDLHVLTYQEIPETQQIEVIGELG